ncbi:outer membrane beta-barrel protein [Snuella lapsa]
MKKNFYIFLLVTLFSLPSVFSQINLKVGANIGGQVSSLRGMDYETDKNFMVVPTLGVNIEVALKPFVSVITGVNFERWKKKRDVRYYNSYNSSSYESTVTEGHDFFNIPFLIRYKFGNKRSFFVDGGGFVNYFNQGKPNGLMSLFINFEDYNFGLALGTGTTFRLNDYLDLIIQVRNELGLTDVNKYKTMLSGNVKTNTIRLIATFNFDI